MQPPPVSPQNNANSYHTPPPEQRSTVILRLNGEIEGKVREISFAPKGLSINKEKDIGEIVKNSITKTQHPSNLKITGDRNLPNLNTIQKMTLISKKEGLAREDNFKEEIEEEFGEKDYLFLPPETVSEELQLNSLPSSESSPESLNLNDVKFNKERTEIETTDKPKDSQSSFIESPKPVNFQRTDNQPELYSDKIIKLNSNNIDQKLYSKKYKEPVPISMDKDYKFKEADNLEEANLFIVKKQNGKFDLWIDEGCDPDEVQKAMHLQGHKFGIDPNEIENCYVIPIALREEFHEKLRSKYPTLFPTQQAQDKTTEIDPKESPNLIRPPLENKIWKEFEKKLNKTEKEDIPFIKFLQKVISNSLAKNSIVADLKRIKDKEKVTIEFLNWALSQYNVLKEFLSRDIQSKEITKERFSEKISKWRDSLPPFPLIVRSSVQLTRGELKGKTFELESIQGELKGKTFKLGTRGDFEQNTVKLENIKENILNLISASLYKQLIEME